MKSSTTQSRNFRPTIGRIVTVLAAASVMAALPITPALAKDHDHHQGHHDNGWHKGEWKGDRDDRRGYQESYYYQHPYNYSQPVYAPPPVYYAPQQSPGISFFFPLDIHRR